MNSTFALGLRLSDLTEANTVEFMSVFHHVFIEGGQADFDINLEVEAVLKPAHYYMRIQHTTWEFLYSGHKWKILWPGPFHLRTFACVKTQLACVKTHPHPKQAHQPANCAPLGRITAQQVDPQLHPNSLSFHTNLPPPPPPPPAFSLPLSIYLSIYLTLERDLWKVLKGFSPLIHFFWKDLSRLINFLMEV